MTKHNNLNKRRILETVLELADEEGLEAVTMRRAAQRLDAGTMSLYYYAPNKEALLEGIVDHVFEQVEQPPDDGRGWIDRIVFASLSFRKAALAHPSVVTLISTGFFSGPAVLQSTEVCMGVLVRGGFDPEDVSHIHRAVTSYTIGYLSLELGGFFGSVAESYRLGTLENAGPEQYPFLAEISPRLKAWEPEREFEAGLRRLLTGFNEPSKSASRYPTPSATESASAPLGNTYGVAPTDRPKDA